MHVIPLSVPSAWFSFFVSFSFHSFFSFFSTHTFFFSPAGSAGSTQSTARTVDPLTGAVAGLGPPASRVPSPSLNSQAQQPDLTKSSMDRNESVVGDSVVLLTLSPANGFDSVEGVSRDLCSLGQR